MSGWPNCQVAASRGGGGLCRAYRRAWVVGPVGRRQRGDADPSPFFATRSESAFGHVESWRHRLTRQGIDLLDDMECGAARLEWGNEAGRLGGDLPEEAGFCQVHVHVQSRTLPKSPVLPRMSQ